MTGRVNRAVALVTCAAHPDLTSDDRLLADALAAGGFRPAAERWDAPARPWEAYHAVVLRSCWDYHHRALEFFEWLDDVERRGIRLFNPVATVRWNARKTYLRDLAGAEIPVVPTAWVAAGDATGLEAILSAHGWRRAVVKPTISATAFETWRTGPTITTAEEHRFARVARERDLMIQPYLEQIETEGELSFVFLGERFSHAVVKRPAAGDFRVQSDFGGTVGVVRPAVALIQQATRALAAVPAPCLYARVDGCVVNGQLVLMELEAIEPVLFFRDVPWAAARFVEALHVTLDSSRRCENHALGSGAAPSSSPPPRTSQAS